MDFFPPVFCTVLGGGRWATTAEIANYMILSLVSATCSKKATNIVRLRAAARPFHVATYAICRGPTRTLFLDMCLKVHPVERMSSFVL